MGMSGLAQSPPLEYIEPIGQGPQFSFTRPQSRHSKAVSSRPSTASGQVAAASHQETASASGDESREYEPRVEDRPARKVEEADFELEEWESDPGYDCDIEVIRPDHFEDAISDIGAGKLEANGLLHQFQDLRCGVTSSDEEEQQRIYRRKKKRWSAGVFKRSHSQSIEGDSSYSDNDPLDDNDSTTRRLRRRVRGPGDRTSLIFEDRGFSSANHILEVEEPDDGEIPHTQGPPSIPSDDAFTLDELPFWVVEGSMDIEVESAY
jgi:hypothetical protein